MASLASGSVVRQIGSLFEGSSVAGLSDRQLLDRFTAQRDAAGEAAFAALGDYGTARWCSASAVSFWAIDTTLKTPSRLSSWSWLRRRASIRDPDLLGNWLYGVALRTSRCARVRLGPSSQERGGCLHGERQPRAPPVPSAEQSVLAREQAELLHDEIERLPRRSAYRSCSATSRGSPSTRPPGGSAARTARSAAEWPGRGQAQARPHSPRRRLARCRTGRGSGTAVGLGVGLIPPVRNHNAGRDPVRGRTGRLARGDGPCPGGAEIHARQ